ncbi:hypothetical protein M2650_15925 [Luteimonas sp. SX5]|uniref:Exo-alpha-sialidase n=1 Tax=Luteimonas galliterrae TaxID=2940486 RepID=A0ABT0MMK7_9GAMM|nr:hypothetical protein [Luteimonas galliterrae]MCL1636111.1 hypothetical protein [Luteimonas galliterrae]
MKAATALVLLPLALLGACQRQAEPSAPTGASGEVRVWPLLAEQGAAQPDLAVAADGRLLLSWISVRKGRDNALQFAAYGTDGRWQSTPKTIAVGEALLSNWADTPHIAATPDGALWVHWLQRTGAGPAEYDLALSRSGNRGFNWSAPVVVNRDQGGEHGFASLWPASPTTLGVAWLNPAQAGEGGAHENHGGMSLRTASFDASLQRIAESPLDEATCECCQTDVAMAASGPVIVYRDRDVDEIRDIAAVRYDGKAWSAPVRVHADGWKMPACPVNGPAVAAKNDDVIVAWYTAAGGVPVLQLARSRDGGASFAAPLKVDRGAAVLGRVDVAYDGKEAWVLWLREEAGAQSLWLARYPADLSKETRKSKVADLQARGSASGFAKLALRADGAYAVWTDAVDGQPRLRGAQILR